MKHQKTIKDLLNTMMESPTFHCLIVQSPPGWAKSTTINDALNNLQIDSVAAGTYNTPLAFYNTMALNPNRTIVLDDCSGLFDDLAAMSVLKAATWPNAKTDKRFIQWSSSSEKVLRPDGFEFTGKLILLTNVFPAGRDTDAFKSRSLFYQISFTRSNIAKLLKEASKSPFHYPNKKRAQQVAKFLIDSLHERDFTKYNLRTLKMGYEFATTHPSGWKELLKSVLPSATPKEVVKKLAYTADKVSDQLQEFQRITGGSERNFYYLRAQLGLATPPGGHGGRRESAG